ncbi:MAG: hypothetical protein LVR00_03100 [Rhabdochlamydiaceae bacterium]|jgi:serine/threonine protein kinase
MHTSGYAHCDIKPENLLVDEEKNPVLIDFESSLEINEENKDKIAGTVIRFHPAVAALTKAVREKDEETKLTLHKRLPPLTSRDVWALGSLFLRMATPEKPLPWSPPPNINDLPTKIKIVENNLINLLSNSSEPVFPKPIDETSLEYLAWNMLQVDPKRQWDLNQVISFLKDHRS